jgi:hypothetical protein
MLLPGGPSTLPARRLLRLSSGARLLLGHPAPRFPNRSADSRPLGPGLVGRRLGRASRHGHGTGRRRLSCNRHASRRLDGDNPGQDRPDQQATNPRPAGRGRPPVGVPSPSHSLGYAWPRGQVFGCSRHATPMKHTRHTQRQTMRRHGRRHRSTPSPTRSSLKNSSLHDHRPSLGASFNTYRDRPLIPDRDPGPSCSEGWPSEGRHAREEGDPASHPERITSKP